MTGTKTHLSDAQLHLSETKTSSGNVGYWSFISSCQFTLKLCMILLYNNLAIYI